MSLGRLVYRRWSELQSAFTLVEILIALAILAMIVASTFTIFRSASKSWQKGEIRSERYNNARISIGKMELEISQAVLNSTDLDLYKFVGDKESIRFISFVSTNQEVFELAEITYWRDKNKNLLMRSEDIEPDYDFSTYDHSDILSDGVSELEFSYYDGLLWNDIWNSDISRGKSILPKAVKIKIMVHDKKGKESEVFEVIARLKTA